MEEIAYKFIAETAETTVTKVEWETSRLGNVIPVVYFNPVKLSGAMLKKCSGFNAKWILDNKIGEGTKIVVHRAGEVIPYITKVLDSGAFELPYTCPDCNAKLGWRGVNKYCPNASCSKKVKENLLLWIESIAQIDSLGNNILIPFLNDMGWKSISDVYNTSKETWEETIKFNWTSHAKDLLRQMYGKLYNQPVDPAKFFVAFGLPSVGTNTSKRIADEIGIDEYFTGKEFDRISWDRLSRKTDPATRALVENFHPMKGVYNQIKGRCGFVSTEKRTDTIVVAITGKLSKGRKELALEFEKYGIEVASSVSKDVDYLITDDPNSGSSKNTAAQKLGIKVISETGFRYIQKI
jgi:DNA ligase (NAD+)